MNRATVHASSWRRAGPATARGWSSAKASDSKRRRRRPARRAGHRRPAVARSATPRCIRPRSLLCERVHVTRSLAGDDRASPAPDPRGHGGAPARLPAQPARARRRQAPTVSSERLAELAGVNAAKVRKDLSYLGSYGTRGVGYDVEYLLFQMSRELGLTQDWPVVIVGIGNLGQALANYGGFGERLPGRRPRRRRPGQGRPAGRRGSEIRHLDELAEHRRGARDRHRHHRHARRASPRRSPTGWSPPASPRSSTSPPPSSRCPTGVSLRKVDLAVELQILSFHQQRRALGEAEASAAADQANGDAGPARRSPIAD